jgi:hypothetical protein
VIDKCRLLLYFQSSAAVLGRHLASVAASSSSLPVDDAEYGVLFAPLIHFVFLPFDLDAFRRALFMRHRRSAARFTGLREMRVMLVEV